MPLREWERLEESVQELVIEETVPAIMVAETVKIGKLEIQPLTTKGDQESWEQNRDEVTYAVNQFGLVIPEYFPPEYLHLKSVGYPVLSGIIDVYDQVWTPLYRQVAEVCQKSQKDVLVLDPAHDLSFAYFRGLLKMAPFVAVSAIATVASAHNLHEDLKTQKSSRRSFLKFLGTSGMIGFMGLNGGLASSLLGMKVSLIGNEDEFRDSMVAEHLIQLGESTNSFEALLIYDPIHWKNIQGFVSDEGARRASLRKYAFLRNLPFFESMFDTRFYPEAKVV